jgi:glycosyltransferase involved in cell wall biosynthesis
MSALNIIYVFRAPVGGLFRQVLDLVHFHHQFGHRLGIICDTLTGGARAEEVFAGLKDKCVLGIHRMPMHRNPHPSDLKNILAIRKLVRDAEGPMSCMAMAPRAAFMPGLMRRSWVAAGRCAPTRPMAAASTMSRAARSTLPTCSSNAFLNAEPTCSPSKAAMSPTASSGSAASTDKTVRVALNGLYPHEFQPRTVAPDATDLVFMGELRAAKGIDLMVQALGRLKARGRNITTTIIGSGPDEAMLKDMARVAGIADTTTFPGPMKGPDGLKRGRIMVVPSRIESLPYIVLEAVAAEVPLVTTDCGGINEIVGHDYPWMVPPGSVDALEQVIGEAIDSTPEFLAASAHGLMERARILFDVEKMSHEVIAAYRAAIAARS